jgi:hypothetical protein
MKFAKSRFLLQEVDQHRPRGDHVDRVRTERKSVRRCPDEVGAIDHSELRRQTSAFGEQIFGDVAEDDAPVRADLLERREGDQSISRPDVEDDVARANLRIGDDAHPEFVKRGKHSLELLLVASVAALEQPLRPPVLRRTRHRSSSR